MDRTLQYAGQVPLETDLLNLNRNAMTALAWALQGVFGVSTFVTDLTVIPATPAALSVVVTPGQVLSLQNTDTAAYSSLSADPHPILKQGILADAVTLAIAPPVSQSQVYLIQAAFSEQDTGSTVLPYYNPAQPAIAFSGPNGGGVAQYTERSGLLLVSAKPGVVSGSPVAPAPDAGYVGLYTVTVGAGATTITSGNIARLDSAPMLAVNGQLPLIPAGVRDGTWITADDTGTANNLVVKVLPPPAAYTKGMTLRVKVAAANTGATQINVNGLGQKNVLRPDGSALAANDLKINQMATLVYDGTAFQLAWMPGVAIAAGSTGSQTYATAGSYTFTVPAGVYQVFANVWGSGGSGAVTAGANDPVSGGGGGGGYAEGWCAVTPGQSIAVTVGAGGASRSANSGLNGAAGGASSFGAFMSANGGGAGSTTAATAGPGGAATGGTLNQTGCPGEDWGSQRRVCNGGQGANGGGAGGLHGTAPDGQGPGGGGGGGNSSARSGAGAAGKVIVLW